MFRHADVVCLCLGYILWQSSMFRRPHGICILQSRSHYCLVDSHECLLLFPHAVAVSVFIVGRGMFACTDML